MVYDAKEKYSSSISPFSSRTVFDPGEKERRLIEGRARAHSQTTAGTNSLLKRTGAINVIFRSLIKNALSLINN